MSLKSLEELNAIDFKEYLNRNWKNQPSYIWVRRTKDDDEECLRIESINDNNHLNLESGVWMAPIPLHDRRNKRINLAQKYPDYMNVYLPDGQKFLNVLRSRKETSNIVAWKSKGRVTKWNISDIIKFNNIYIEQQRWKCRYCNHINQGTNICQGTYFGQLPHGGPPKANNNVLAEFEYFLAKPVTCPPMLLPFKTESYLGWHNSTARAGFQQKIQGEKYKCNAKRCVHFSHINQSDQILSFPRTQWTNWGQTYVTNTEQFFLPGAMLGHQTTQSESQCPKCRTSIQHEYKHNFDSEWRLNVEHSWWIIEVLYWLKVDIYNKKMQKLSDIEADKRYTFLLDAMNKLNKLSIQDFVYYGENGSYQTIPFNNILKNMTDWMTDRNKYNTRFERKKIPPGFIVNRLNLKF